MRFWFSLIAVILAAAYLGRGGLSPRLQAEKPTVNPPLREKMKEAVRGTERTWKNIKGATRDWDGKPVQLEKAARSTLQEGNALWKNGATGYSLRWRKAKVQLGQAGRTIQRSMQSQWDALRRFIAELGRNLKEDPSYEKE